MAKLKNFFGGRWGVVLAGAVVGVIAPLLQKLGNPGNMGVCVACFERDIAGALGLHRAAVVQAVRPELIGFVLGALLAAVIFREFRPRAGSAPVVRFVLGAFGMVGALVFLGCPWRALLRLSAGDGNAVLGLAGLTAGIWIGTLFFRKGYSLGRSHSTCVSVGLILPAMVIGLLVLRIICPPPSADAAGEALAAGLKSVRSGVLFYSIAGPGKMCAPLVASLGAGLLIGFLAQRSRFCTMGAIRDLILFRHPHLFWGVLALVVAAAVSNVVLGQFHPGFKGQPAAHGLHVWNFAGMMLAGLAFALAGGCPGRQLFMCGEGDGDAAVFVMGMIAGAAFAHNFGLASSPKGLGPHGAAAVVLGMVVCLAIGFTMRDTGEVT